MFQDNNDHIFGYIKPYLADHDHEVRLCGLLPCNALLIYNLFQKLNQKNDKKENVARLFFLSIECLCVPEMLTSINVDKKTFNLDEMKKIFKPYLLSNYLSEQELQNFYENFSNMDVMIKFLIKYLNKYCINLLNQDNYDQFSLYHKKLHSEIKFIILSLTIYDSWYADQYLLFDSDNLDSIVKPNEPLKWIEDVKRIVINKEYYLMPQQTCTVRASRINLNDLRHLKKIGVPLSFIRTILMLKFSTIGSYIVDFKNDKERKKMIPNKVVGGNPAGAGAQRDIHYQKDMHLPPITRHLQAQSNALGTFHGNRDITNQSRWEEALGIYDLDLAQFSRDQCQKWSFYIKKVGIQSKSYHKNENVTNKTNYFDPYMNKNNWHDDTIVTKNAKNVSYYPDIIEYNAGGEFKKPDRSKALLVLSTGEVYFTVSHYQHFDKNLVDLGKSSHEGFNGFTCLTFL